MADRVVAVVPAAGRGLRFGDEGNKLFTALVDRPVLAHTLGVLQASPVVDEVVVAVGPGEEDFCRREVLDPFELRKVTGVIRGGASRQESVGLALRFIGTDADLVLIHDGARPLLPPGLLQGMVPHGAGLGALAAAVPARDTIKRVAPGDGPEGTRVVAETLDRAQLWQVQTPQLFWRDLIQLAYRRGQEAGWAATDDAELVERLREPVHLWPGSEENLKVTTPLDIVLARAILEDRARRRVATPAAGRGGNRREGTGQ